jgi:hypothetical protein
MTKWERRVPEARAKELQTQLKAAEERSDAHEMARIFRMPEYQLAMADEAVLHCCEEPATDLRSLHMVVEADKRILEFKLALERAQRRSLEKRVEELAARPQVEYRGIWSETETYKAGHFVTDRGSVWACRAQVVTGERPGASVAWQLAVKRGADGRDAGR